MSRILLDPASADGGAGAAQTPASTQNTLSATPPATVPIPVSELQALMTRLARVDDYEAREKARDKEAADKVTAALLAKGQAEEAVKGLDARYQGELSAKDARLADTERRASTFARDTALTTALASHGKVRPAAIPQLKQLLSAGLEAVADGDGFSVRTPATSPSPYKTPAAYVAEILARPEYAHFLEPDSTGGSGASGGDRTNPTVPDGRPQTLEEAVDASWRAANNPQSVPSWQVPIQRQLIRRN